jgi:hypothetical protein
VSVKRLQPTTSCILLEESYPQFQTTWVQPLVLKIKLLEAKNTTIEVSNSEPPTYQDEIWRNLYGVKYATPEKFTSDIPKLTINIVTTVKQDNQGVTTNGFFQDWLFTIAIIVGIVVVAAYGVYRKCKKAERS